MLFGLAGKTRQQLRLIAVTGQRSHSHPKSNPFATFFISGPQHCCTPLYVAFASIFAPEMDHIQYGQEKSTGTNAPLALKDILQVCAFQHIPSHSLCTLSQRSWEKDGRQQQT